MMPTLRTEDGVELYYQDLRLRTENSIVRG